MQNIAVAFISNQRNIFCGILDNMYFVVRVAFISSQRNIFCGVLDVYGVVPDALAKF
jgi:hypothetical protein